MHYSTRQANQVPAYCLTGRCPQCGKALAIRHTRQDREPFIGCTSFPLCRYTAEYDDALQALGELLSASEARVAQLERRGRAAHPHTTPPLSQPALDRALKTLVAVCHPDRWDDSPVATELCKAINNLRQRAQEGLL